MGDRCVVLRATNPERNVNRSWACWIEEDLFGACVVSVTFGRAGTKGRTIKRVVSDDVAADRFLAGALTRRRGSVKRCGAVYRILEARGFEGRLVEMSLARRIVTGTAETRRGSVSVANRA
ncbi:MAG: WGR domain-containing protein [Proteobacteria bacterium]|nr:WGR domain-containing protein [Pseudomonadota bacterium]